MAIACLLVFFIRQSNSRFHNSASENVVSNEIHRPPSDLDWHTSPDLWTKARAYHYPYDENNPLPIQVREVDPIPVPTNRVFSSNGGYWFSVDSTDSLQGPWTNRITVFNERDHNVEITLIRQSNYNTDVEWINEKLLFIEVGWSRMYGTDMIYDVETEEMIYKEMVSYGVLVFQQFQQWKLGQHIVCVTLFIASHIAPEGISEITINIVDSEVIYIRQSADSWKERYLGGDFGEVRSITETSVVVHRNEQDQSMETTQILSGSTNIDWKAVSEIKLMGLMEGKTLQFQRNESGASISILPDWLFPEFSINVTWK